MTTSTQTTNIQKLKIASPPQREQPAELAAGDEITLINDSTLPFMVCVANGFLGPRSVGYVHPGQTVKMPSGPALWDVYLLKESTQGVMLWTNGLWFEVRSTFMKSNVNSMATLKVSEFMG